MKLWYMVPVVYIRRCGGRFLNNSYLVCTLCKDEKLFFIDRDTNLNKCSHINKNRIVKNLGLYNIDISQRFMKTRHFKKINMQNDLAILKT